jgi:hypothetical protein
MDFVINHVLVLHILGVAAIVGSAVFVARGVVTPALLWGARVQVLTGLALVGLKEGSKTAADPAPDHTWVAVKLVVALVVVACVEIANARHRKGSDEPRLVHAAGGLAVLNVLVAILWSQG